MSSSKYVKEYAKEITETKTSSSHTWNMLASLKTLRCNGDFCDVSIISRHYRVRAHRTVLSSATEYFKAMFMNETKEAKTGIVDFSKMLPEVVKQCIGFIYSGKVEISMAIVRDLVDASEMLQLPELAKLCVEYLAGKVNLKNCAEVISLSYLYSKDSLKEPLQNFLRIHFKEFKETDEFSCFAFGALKHCYSLLGKGDSLHEQDKWFGILKWVETDTRKRKCHFDELFTLICLNVIPKVFLKQHISSNAFVTDSIQCVRSVLENVLDDDKERAASTIVSFRRGSDLISSCSVQENLLVRAPVKVTVDMDVIQHRGNIFVGTGLKIYAYVNEVWVMKDVDFTKVSRTSPCVTCPVCHEDHWFVGKRCESKKLLGNLFFMSRRPQSGSFDIPDHQDCPKCSKCQRLMDKNSSNESCYNRCVGVGDSVYMLTMEYVIEYIISTSQIVHHNVSIRLGNGFSVAASSECIYAVGGNDTGSDAVAIDVKSKLVTRLKSMLNPKSFGRAIFDYGRLYATSKSADHTEYYDLGEKCWKNSEDRILLKRSRTGHLGEGLQNISKVRKVSPSMSWSDYISPRSQHW